MKPKVKYIGMSIWSNNVCVASSIYQYNYNRPQFKIHNDFVDLIWRVSGAKTVEEFVEFVKTINSCRCEEDTSYPYNYSDPFDESFQKAMNVDQWKATGEVRKIRKIEVANNNEIVWIWEWIKNEKNKKDSEKS